MHTLSLALLCHHSPHQSGLLLSSKSGAVVWIYSLQSDVYSPLPFLNEQLTITLSLTAANYCHLNEGLTVCLRVCFHLALSPSFKTTCMWFNVPQGLPLKLHFYLFFNYPLKREVEERRARWRDEEATKWKSTQEEEITTISGYKGQKKGVHFKLHFYC